MESRVCHKSRCAACNAKGLCSACGLRVVANRGLCRRCRDERLAAGVLAPSKFRGGVREVGDFYGTGLPCEPTKYLPGTLRKLVILRRRAANGQRLWHPADAGADLE